MARFFVKNGQLHRDRAFIEGSDVRHIGKVLRLSPGDKVTLVGEQGTEYEAVIVKLNPEQVECEIINEIPVDREPPVEVVLCQGLPKGDKLEEIIQKSVELGVSRIIPVECARSVVRLSADKAAKRLERWQRVALEAAKQSRRSRIPEVAPLTELAKAMELVPPGALALIPWEEEQGQGLKSVLENYTNKGPVWIFVGPEGGFEESEVRLVRDRGVIPVTLGPRILRTETAGPAVLAMVLYELGDLGGIAF